ncbi:hypothetical protein B0F90DRAFT_1814543 [Multifurca ochricompacta]|uniref:SH3 domain-containing protein n=1 Tax=Multifurca ochricompacta TaxID=376703 RepID=A0AAD4QSA3_9AGAM|nr:hypothetical protein B0F90DRAFT_1814543 [Multifurca ochricompacta]
MHVPVGIRSFERHIVRVAEPDASSSTQSTSTQVPTSGPVPIQLSSSAKSLIGSCTVVGAILFAVIAWKLHCAYKRRKARTIRTRLSIVYGSPEKPTLVSLTEPKGVDEPRKVVLPPAAPSSPTVGWVPQIKSITLPSGVAVPPVAITAPSRSPKFQDERPPTPNSGPSVPSFPSPPPAYRVLGLHTVPLPPPPSESLPSEIPPPTPMSRKFSDTASTPVRESFDLPPIPSPRSASFNSSMSAPTSPPRVGITAVFAPKPLPRLMLVATSFKPNRDDELAVRAGETLRLVKEFEDEWCLVQRVGRPDAEKGVVPSFCLVDRPRIIKNRVMTLSNLTFNGRRK